MNKLVLLLLLTGACLSGCAGFDDWRYLPAAKHEERTVHVVSHGWHTGVVISRRDLGESFGFLDVHLPVQPLYEFGWGEEEFYQAETVTTRLVLKALFLRNPTVMHVAGIPVTPERYFATSEVVRLHLSATGLERLKRSLLASFRMAENMPVALKKGIYGESRFFQANGRYSITTTCNTWTASLLADAGVPMDSLTLRAGSVMSQVRNAAARYRCCAEETMTSPK